MRDMSKGGQNVGSNDRLSNIGACNTAGWPHSVDQKNEANFSVICAAINAKCSDDGQCLHVQCGAKGGMNDEAIA